MKLSFIAATLLTTLLLVGVCASQGEAASTTAYLTDFVQLSTSSFYDRYPVWSSDGSKVMWTAFGSDEWSRNIWVMNSDGTDKQQLTFGNVVDETGSFSPNMKQILFSRWGLRGDVFDVYMLNLTTMTETRFTFDSIASSVHPGSNQWPQYSQDGTKILFSQGTLEANGSTTFRAVVMNADGPYDSAHWTVLHTKAAQPRWAANDEKIIFSHAYDGRMAMINADGTGFQYLTSGPRDGVGSLSPDGSRLVFSRAAEPFPESIDLYYMKVGGTDLQQLTFDKARNDWPSMSPDGQWIVFSSKRSGNEDIWKARIVLSPVSLTPSSGFAATTLVGTLSPNSNVTVTWDGMVIPTIPNYLRTDASGNFAAIVTVPTQTSPGMHTVNATDDLGNWAIAMFTVTDMTGPQGPKGGTGAQGQTGLQGLQGVQGLQGPKGDTGVKGDIGIAGPTGPQGPAGEARDFQLLVNGFTSGVAILAVCLATIALLKKKT